MQGRARRILSGCAALGLLVGALLPLPAGAVAPANEHFGRTWARTDLPVSAGQATRTWMWGPDAFTGLLQEPYADSPGGTRAVQYFDKSRMEITQPNADSNSIWYVTNGLLVVEMITGMMQTGDAGFEARSPAAVNVAGDAGDTSGPTYATFASVLDAAPLPVGNGHDLVGISWAIDRQGNVVDSKEWGDYGVTTAYYDEITNHTIAMPFWQFMNSTGTVYEGGAYVTAPLFENAFYATGRPITEAYWATVLVGGTPTDVLMQCFERRCLTYTPSNAPEWQVEAGNVGRHYHAWRYAQAPPTEPPGGDDTATEYESVTSWGGEFVPGASFYDPHEIVIDAQGHLWLADTNNHRIIEFDEHGVQLRAIGSEGSGPLQFVRPTDIAFDAAGNIYVAEFDGNRLHKLSPDGQFIKTWGKLGSAPGDFYRPAALAISGDTIYVSEWGNNRVQMFGLEGNYLGFWGKPGTGNGEFDHPAGIAIDTSGNVLVVDSVNNRVQRFDPTGVYLSQFGSFGAGPGLFAGPWAIAVGADGTIYIAEEDNKRVQVLAPNGDQLAQWGTEGTSPGQFRAPQGIAPDAEGNVYVVERRDGRVQKFTAEGVYLYEFRDGRRGRFGSLAGIEIDEQGRALIPDALAGFARVQVYESDGTPAFDLTPSAGTPDALTMPLDIAIAPSGLRYVLDGVVVRCYSANWEYSSSFSTPLSAPQAIAVDAAGNVYLADTGNNRIVKFDADGLVVTSWGSAGTGQGQFDTPSGIAVTGSTVYVADTNNHRIQMFDLDGGYIGQWGGSGTGEGQLDRPIGIAADADGYLYVVDHGNGRIQKYDADGAFIAAWGSPGAQPGQLNAPWGIAVDARGYVFVTEPGGYRVQVFRPVE